MQLRLVLQQAWYCRRANSAQSVRFREQAQEVKLECFDALEQLNYIVPL
jgi:hypothetical protein